MKSSENRHNTVSGCWIEQMSVNGITLCNRFGNPSGKVATRDRLEHNVLTNNRIHDVGQLSIYNACVNLVNGSHNKVSHSELAKTLSTLSNENCNFVMWDHPGLLPSKSSPVLSWISRTSTSTGETTFADGLCSITEIRDSLVIGEILRENSDNPEESRHVQKHPVHDFCSCFRNHPSAVSCAAGKRRGRSEAAERGAVSGR
jgi:hypothetical protein